MLDKILFDSNLIGKGLRQFKGELGGLKISRNTLSFDELLNLFKR